MQNLEHGYDNPHANEINKIRGFYFGNKDNPPKSRYTETYEAFQERRKNHETIIYNMAKDKAALLSSDIDKRDNEVKSKINSILFPNSTSYDEKSRALGDSQLTRAQQIISSNPNKQQLISFIDNAIVTRSRDSLGVLKNHFANMTPTTRNELELKVIVNQRLDEFFKQYDLNKYYLEAQKIEAVRPRLKDLKNMFGLS